MRGLILLVTLFLAVTVFLTASTRVKSQTDMSSVSTTVKISVCGDGVVEGPEDCEGSDLAGNSCSDLGFGGGELVCDIGCEFDTTGCLVATPIPSPTSTTVLSSASNKVSSVADSEPALEVVASVAPVPVRIIEEVVADLPIVVADYDLDGSGSLEREELEEIVKTWVRVMRRGEEGFSCDFNDDSICNIIDFSILLFYVGR